MNEGNSAVGWQELPMHKPYPVIQFTKDIIAVLSPEPAIYYKGTEKMGLCKNCDGKCVKFYRKLVCANCGNEYSLRMEFPISKDTRQTLNKVAKHLANKERDRRRAQIRLLLREGRNSE